MTGTVGDLLCHHIGSCILEYYRAIKGEPNHFPDRFAFLKQLAGNPSAFQPAGDVTQGFYLARQQEKPAPAPRRAKP